MRSASTSIPRNAAPFIVAASGCAPPIPPMPPVTTSFPAKSPPKCFFAAACKRFQTFPPAEFLACQCKSSFPRSSARTSSIRRGPVREICPSYLRSPPDWNCTATLARSIFMRAKNPHRLARLDQQSFITFAKSSQRSQQSRENSPNSAPLFPSRPKPPNLPASRQPRGPDCSSACAKPLPAASLYQKSPSRAPPEMAPARVPHQLQPPEKIVLIIEKLPNATPSPFYSSPPNLAPPTVS